MESFDQSSLNTSDNKLNNATVANADLHLQSSNNNINNNNKYINNNKMVSSTMIKHEMSGGCLMPSVLTAAPPPPPPASVTPAPAAGSLMQMENNTNQSQIQQQQQQQQKIINKNGGAITTSATTINSPKMGSRRIFTPQFKLQVLESYRNDNDCKGNQRATARKYNIHRRQIQKWLQCESNLRSSVANINQSQVKHQFHNITPNNTAAAAAIVVQTTTQSSHNSQFVSQQQKQQQQQQQQHYHQQQQMKQNVPSTPTSTTTPCTAAGVLVAANFAAAVAAAASVSMANVETTSSLAPIRPTAIVGSGSSDDVAGVLHPHFTHHLPPHHHHHHHHHMHPHHHPYSTLPYTHSAVPILTHHQPLYPHPAAAALLAAAHHHLPQHQMPNSAVLQHHHHYQQQQQQQQQQQEHEYHQQQQQQQQLYATAAAVNSNMADKEPLEVEVVGDADTDSEADIGNHNSLYSPTTKMNMKTGNGNDYEREQLEFENGSVSSKCKNGNNNNNCNRVRLTAVYKLHQQQQEELLSSVIVEKQSLTEQTTITPIDLSMSGTRRHTNNNRSNNHKILMTKDEETLQKYDKHDDVINKHYNIHHCNQEPTNNAHVVDLTFRKRKVMSKTAITLDNIQAENVTASALLNTSSTSTSSSSSTTTLSSSSVLVARNENKDDDTQPEKMPKFSAHQSFNTSVSSNGIKTATAIETIQIKQEQMPTHHDVNATTNTTTTTATSTTQNAVSKPVKLFKPYLLHEEEEEEAGVEAEVEEEVDDMHKQEEEKFHLNRQQQPFVASTPTQAVPTTETFQGGGNKYTFPIGSPYFQSNGGSGSNGGSPKSVLYSPTSPIGFQRFSKGSPVSGYESSSSTYSECSSHRGLSHYSLDLQLRAVYSEQLGSPTHLHFSPHCHQHQLLTTTPQHHFQGWLDQDTQSSLATCSTRSSPTPTPTPTPPTTRTPPASNTSIALYA